MDIVPQCVGVLLCACFMLHAASATFCFLQLPGWASSQGLKQETEVCKSSVCMHPVSWPHMMTGSHVVPG